MSVYMHDKWPLIYESILPNCKCFATVYDGFCGQDGLVLALRANSVQQKATIQAVHQRIGFRCEWHTETLGNCGCAAVGTTP